MLVMINLSIQFRVRMATEELGQLPYCAAGSVALCIMVLSNSYCIWPFYVSLVICWAGN